MVLCLQVEVSSDLQLRVLVRSAVMIWYFSQRHFFEAGVYGFALFSLACGNYICRVLDVVRFDDIFHIGRAAVTYFDGIPIVYLV